MVDVVAVASMTAVVRMTAVDRLIAMRRMTAVHPAVRDVRFLLGVRLVTRWRLADAVCVVVVIGVNRLLEVVGLMLVAGGDLGSA